MNAPEIKNRIIERLNMIHDESLLSQLLVFFEKEFDMKNKSNGGLVSKESLMLEEEYEKWKNAKWLYE